jgi:hypothetical protein
MENNIISTLLFGVSILCFVIAFSLIYQMTAPTTYGVNYEFHGEKGYAEVQGNVVEIIDSLRERQMIHDITPIR